MNAKNLYAWADAPGAPVAQTAVGTGLVRIAQFGMEAGSADRTWRFTTQEANEMEKVLDLRRTWLREMGLTEDEVEELCRAPVPPLDEAFEREQIAAVRHLRTATPSYDSLRGWARRTGPD